MKRKGRDDETKRLEPWDGTNYSFPKFDRAIMSWARKEWNEELGRSLWEDRFPEELFDIPETASQWIAHVEMVHRSNLYHMDFKRSDELYNSAMYWTHGF